MTEIDTSREEVEWPREIWMAELDRHHNGTGMVVFSEFATIPRYEQDDERDCDFHHYIDADIHESAEKYWLARAEKAEAERDAAWNDAIEAAAEAFPGAYAVYGGDRTDSYAKGYCGGIEKFKESIRALRKGGETCRKCGGTMRPGKALAQTFTEGTPDFPGDTHATTLSAGGPGKMIDVMKCGSCGWSVRRR